MGAPKIFLTFQKAFNKTRKNKSRTTNILENSCQHQNENSYDCFQEKTRSRSDFSGRKQYLCTSKTRGRLEKSDRDLTSYKKTKYFFDIVFENF